MAVIAIGVPGSSDAQVVVCEDQEQLDKVLEVRARLPRLRALVVIDPKGLRRYEVDGLMTFEEVSVLGAAFEALLASGPAAG